MWVKLIHKFYFLSKILTSIFWDLPNFKVGQTRATCVVLFCMPLLTFLYPKRSIHICLVGNTMKYHNWPTISLLFPKPALFFLAFVLKHYIPFIWYTKRIILQHYNFASDLDSTQKFSYNKHIFDIRLANT